MDGNRYKNQQEFGERMYYRAQAMGQEHLMFQGGQMYRIRNQEKTQLNESMILKDGTKVNPDGNIQLKDQKQQRLRDGECLDMQGNRYENQDRFRDGMEKQERERMGHEKGNGKEDPNDHSKGKKN